MKKVKPENPYNRFVEGVGEATVLLLLFAFGAGLILGFVVVTIVFEIVRSLL